MKPEELQALADRIDNEELWRLSLLERDSMTQEDRDKLDAGVNLRRFADARFTLLQELETGREYMRGYKFTRVDHSTDHRGCGDNDWHGAINKFAEQQHKDGKTGAARMMYTAKLVSDEVPRMILLFDRERRGMPESWKMCGHDPRPATPLPDNHLRCALGHECRKCPYLSAIESDERMTNEAKDEAKAWTCATHILLDTQEESHYFEQFLFDKSDDAFNDRMLASFCQELPD